MLFTAHSLPQRILEAGDPYPDQLAETAAALAERAGVERWSVAWQSAGRTADPWIGPDVLDVLRERSAAGTRAVVVCSCGFVADHLEVLYDLDIEAQGVADELGLAFARTASPNADPAFTRTLAGIVPARRGRGLGPGRRMSRHVVIVGAGIAGLAAAHELARAPDAPQVTILEASERAGGRIRSVPFAGVELDVGPDALLSRAPGRRRPVP